MGGFSPPVGAPATVHSTPRDVARIDAATSLIRDVDPDVQFETADAAPLTAMIKTLNKADAADQRKFEWPFVPDYPQMLTVAAAATAAATTIVVNAGEFTRLHRGMQLWNTRTGEVFTVGGSAEPSSTTIDIIGRAGAAAMEVNDQLRIIGVALEDNNEKTAIRSQLETFAYNFCQIHETVYGLTGRAQNSSSYMGSELAYERKKAMVRHNKGMEEILLNGVRGQFASTGYANSTELTYTGGVKYWTGSNRWNLNNTRPTEAQVMDFFAYVLQYGPGGYEHKGQSASKLVLYSPAWAVLIDSFAKGQIQYEPVSTKLGLKIGFWQSSVGDLMLKLHPMWGQPGYRDLLLILDMSLLKYKPHKGRDTTVHEGVETPGSDRKENLIRSDFGLQASGDERAHGMITGLNLSVS